MALGVACTGAASGMSGSPTAGPSTSHGSTAPTTAPEADALAVRSAGYGLIAPIQRSVAVWDGGVIYIAGGLDAANTTVGGVFSMNPISGHLTPLGSLARPVHDAAAAMISGKLFVFAGGEGAGSDAVQAFDPATGTGSVVGHLPVALSDLAAAQIGDVTYLVGGYDGTRPRSEIYATTDGTTFSTVGHLPVGLRYPAVTQVGGRLVIAGGLASSGPVNDVYTFDPSSGTTTSRWRSTRLRRSAPPVHPRREDLRRRRPRRSRYGAREGERDRPDHRARRGGATAGTARRRRRGRGRPPNVVDRRLEHLDVEQGAPRVPARRDRDASVPGQPCLGLARGRRQRLRRDRFEAVAPIRGERPDLRLRAERRARDGRGDRSEDLPHRAEDRSGISIVPRARDPVVEHALALRRCRRGERAGRDRPAHGQADPDHPRGRAPVQPVLHARRVEGDRRRGVLRPSGFHGSAHVEADQAAHDAV